MNILINILRRTKALWVIFRHLLINFLIKLDIIKKMIWRCRFLLNGDLQTRLTLRMVWFLHLTYECWKFCGTWGLVLRKVCNLWNLWRHIKVGCSWRSERPAIKRALTDLAQIGHWHWLIRHRYTIHQVLHFVLVLVFNFLIWFFFFITVLTSTWICPKMVFLPTRGKSRARSLFWIRFH